MPHQREIVDVAFEIDPDTGYLAYDQVIVIGPRQATGKTELALPVMAHRCTGFGPALARWVRDNLGHDVVYQGPQRVLYTAQTAELAREKWRDIHVKRIDDSPLRALWKQPPRLRLAAETMFWQNGSTWSPMSATGKTAGTGDSIDLGFIDEAWSRENNRTELGMRPAMMTRFWKQLWVLSMIPGLSRAAPDAWPYLMSKRTAGRHMVDVGRNTGTAFFEFSAAEGLDPGDPATWWSCMPGLGITVPERAIRSDFESGMPLVDFCAEYLGWEPKTGGPQWQVVSEHTWTSLLDPYSTPLDPIALGVDCNPERTVSSVSMAALRADGGLHIELIDRRPGVNWTVEALVSLCRQNRPCAIGMDGNGPYAGSKKLDLERAMVEANMFDIPILAANGKEIAGACGTLFDGTGQVPMEPHPVTGELLEPRWVRHIGQPELTAALAGSIKYMYGAGGQWRWARSADASEVSSLYAATCAMWAGDQVEWIGGSYDIADSLG